MTDDQIKDWKHERNMARAIKNDADRAVALQDCYDHRDEMMMTCIAHQSKRVKIIMEDHDAMVESHKMYQAQLLKEKGEKEGYKKIIAFFKWLAALGGSGGVGAILANFVGG